MYVCIYLCTNLCIYVCMCVYGICDVCLSNLIIVLYIYKPVNILKLSLLIYDQICFVAISRRKMARLNTTSRRWRVLSAW